MCVYVCVRARVCVAYNIILLFHLFILVLFLKHEAMSTSAATKFVIYLLFIIL